MNLVLRRGVGVCVMVLAAAIVLRLYMIVASSLYIPVTSDESITVLQAKEIISGKPSLFVWAQPYQFPAETYMLAPIVKFLPRNGFGARFHSFVISFLSLAAMFLIFRRMGSWRQIWPGLLLVLFPSAYLMMIQFGYPVPHYTPAFLFGWIAIYLASCIPSAVNRKGLILLALTGFFCGLAFTTNMVSMAIVLPVAIVVCWGTDWKRFLIHIPVFWGGAFAGLLPYLAGIWRYPEAQAPVAGTRSLSEAFSRFWNPTLFHTLPRALGIDPGVFPDSHYTVQYGERFVGVIAVVYILVLVYGTVLSLLRIIEELVGRRRPLLTINEIFIGASWLCLILFLLSKRADGNAYRYLVPAAWSFPFVIYYTYNGLPWRLRPFMAMFVILLSCFNVGTSLRLINAWKEPDYCSRVVGCPDLKPVLGFLKDNQIEYCVASHWAAYRISFLSDEKIICSQPYNERFGGWAVPYKSRVDNASRVAYVLTDNVRFLKPRIFEKHMKQMRVESRKETCGRFEVYYDFDNILAHGEKPVSCDDFKVVASNNPKDSDKIRDDDRRSFWRTDRLQEEGMWVQVDFDVPRVLNRLIIDRGDSSNDHPEQMYIESKNGDSWENIKYETLHDWRDEFRFENGHPVYSGPNVKTFLLQPVRVQSFRLYISEPRKDWAWTINELRIWETTAAVDEQK